MRSGTRMPDRAQADAAAGPGGTLLAVVPIPGIYRPAEVEFIMISEKLPPLRRGWPRFG